MVLRGRTGTHQPQGLRTAQLLQQSRTIDAQGAWLPAPTGANPLCSWFLTSGTISSLEAVPLCFHNFCSNNCQRKHSIRLAVPPAAYQGIPTELPGRAAQAGGAATTPELAGPLGCSSAGQVPGFAKPFPPAQKVTFLFNQFMPLISCLV